MKKQKAILTSILFALVAMFFFYAKETNKLISFNPKNKNVVATYIDPNSARDFQFVSEETLNKKKTHQKRLKNLRYAYTGNWKKNELKTESFSFDTPINTRNDIAKDTKNSKKLKKLAEKKKSTKKKIAKKSPFRNFNNRFAYNTYNRYSYPTHGRTINSPNTNAVYTYGNGQEEIDNTPQSENPEQPSLSLEEWYNLIISTNNISKLIDAFKGNKISSSDFYTLIHQLFNSNKIELKKLAMEALAKTPSITSFELMLSLTEQDSSQEVQDIANEYFKTTYQTLTQLTLLNFLLKSQNEAVQIKASSLISGIVQDIQNALVHNPERISQFLELYRNSLATSQALLEALLQSGLNGTIVASFNETLSLIHQLLG